MIAFWIFTSIAVLLGLFLLLIRPGKPTYLQPPRLPPAPPLRPLLMTHKAADKIIKDCLEGNCNKTTANVEKAQEILKRHKQLIGPGNIPRSSTVNGGPFIAHEHHYVYIGRQVIDGKTCDEFYCSGCLIYRYKVVEHHEQHMVEVVYPDLIQLRT